MPQTFIPGRRTPRGGGPKTGRNPTGRRPGVTINVGGFQVSLRSLAYMVLTGQFGALITPRGSRPPPRIHPLHFVPPGLPGVITACTLQPEVCVPAAAVLTPVAIPATIGAVIAGTAFAIVERAQALTRQRRQREIESELERERIREAQQSEYARVHVIPTPPDTLPFYDYPVLPPLIARPAPGPVRVDTVADPLPDIRLPTSEPVPFPSFPLVSPQIAPPRPVVAPALPRVQPFTFPNPATRPFPFPTLPLTQPLIRPITIPGLPNLPLPPLPTLPGLTLPQPVGLPSNLVSPQSFAQPQAQPKGKQGRCECPDTRTKKRKRTRCNKGLYRERAGTITYTPWSQVDCVTGREH